MFLIDLRKFDSQYSFQPIRKDSKTLFTKQDLLNKILIYSGPNNFFLKKIQKC